MRLFKSLAKIRQLINRSMRYVSRVWRMDEDEIIEIAKKMLNIEYSSKCYNVSTDSQGLVKFYVPLKDVPEDVVKLSLKVRALNFPAVEATKMKEPEKKLDVTLTHVNYTMTMGIQDKERKEIECDEEFTAEVYFSSNQNTDFDLHYYAMAKGKLIKSDSMRVEVGSDDLTEELVAGATELRATDCAVGQDETGKVVSKAAITLPIDHSVSPSLKLVVFTSDEDSTLTDTHTYTVSYTHLTLPTKA